MHTFNAIFRVSLCLNGSHSHCPTSTTMCMCLELVANDAVVNESTCLDIYGHLILKGNGSVLLTHKVDYNLQY